MTSYGLARRMHVSIIQDNVNLIAERIRLFVDCNYDCEEMYEPVCAQCKSGILKTFPNVCELAKKQCECLDCGKLYSNLMICILFHFTKFQNGITSQKDRVLMFRLNKFFSNFLQIRDQKYF